jgi:dolichol-phosphate mannosyltransferase
MPEIRLLRTPCGRVRARPSQPACATHVPWVATLDGDGQNDPADIPKLLDAALGSSSPKLKLVMGNRDATRHVAAALSSRVANGVRGAMLKDGTPDTGCRIKVFDRAVFVDMPRFKNMHRFMPALYQRGL